jgi:octaprenyl-diphosphate synthase
MDFLSLIKQPIDREFSEFETLFSQALTHGDRLLSDMLSHIRKRGGKRMRPILMLLIAKNYGNISDVTQNAAIGLELLHTASLVHDDVVDESGERRGQASVNATYNNKAAVLLGDFLLSTALLHVSYTDNQLIIQNLAELGRTLAQGELLQLWNISNTEISEDIYYDVIRQKTAVLFESCSAIGAMSAGASEDEVQKARKFGRDLGIMFQIRDDIFDYYDSKEIGKPTGNDMAEGKLTLPVIYALNNNPQYESMQTLARKVKQGTINADEIAVLVEFTKRCGGIDYAEKCMEDYHSRALEYLEESVKNDAIRHALKCYLDYVIHRTK